MLTNKNNLMTEQRKKAGHSKKFWPMLVAFYALFFIRNLLSVEFPVVLYLVWVAIMAFSFDDTEIKALLISFIPLAPGFQSKYAILVCMIILLIRYGKQIKLPLFVFIVPFLMFWEFLHLGDGFSSTAEYLSGFAPIMCMVIIVSLPDKEENTAFFTRVLAISAVVGSVIVIANTVREYNQSLLSMIQEGFRLGEVEEAEDYLIVYNANGLGYLCNLGIVGLLINVYFKKANKLDYLVMVVLAVVGCLTVSRTFLLCFAGTMVAFVLLQERSFSQKAKTFAASAVSLILAFVVLKIAAPEIIDNYVERFNADDVTGGREYLFEYYNKFITSSPSRLWYGIGIQNISEKVLHFEGVVVNVPHNGYQQMIVGWGIIGLVLMMSFVLCLILHARKKNRHAPLMCYLPLILLLINILGGQFVTSGIKMLSLYYIYLMICNGGKETAENIIAVEKHN